MKLRSAAVLAMSLLVPLGAQAQQPGGRGIFPYAYHVDDLPNGLRVVTVPTDYPNLVAFYTVINAGSRNEVEPGKSGFAHFFEHMMFRGSENYTPEQRDEILKRAGASANAYTSDDRTVYHQTFSKDDLEAVIKLEADRFQRLKYAEPEYRTEALAVLGEYNKNSANPISKLYETLRATAFRRHTFAHTTMGFLQDIQDMPNQYAYSQEFYRRFYRPEYATIVVVGDVQRDNVLRMVREHFGSWQRGNYVAQIPAEPAQDAPRTAHIDWPSETLPHVAVAFRAPAYSDTSKEKAALDLLAAVAFGETSDLYRRLVLTEQKVDIFGSNFENLPDPELFTLLARVKDPRDVDYVRDQMLATVARYRTEPIDAAQLDAVRSRMKYSFAMSMNSSDAIADALAPFIALRRSPETLDRLFALYAQVTPADIRAAAQKYLVDNNRTIVTLATKKAAE